MSKVEQIQAEIDNKNAAIEQEAANGQQTNHEQIIQWRNEISVLQMQLSDAKTEETNQQERVQAQTEKVESITLPLDFNDLLENPLANEMIIEVVKQFQLQAYEEHNTEVTRINAEWTDRVSSGNAIRDALIEQLSGLHEDIQSLTNDLKGEKEMYADLEAHNLELRTLLNQAKLEKADAETKRDAAARELEQAAAEIERLKQPKAQTSLDIGGNDKLNELAKQAKESAEQKAARGLTRWNQDNPSLAVAPLEFPVLPTLDPINVEQGNNVEQVIPSEDQIPAATPGLVGSAPSVLGESAKEETPVTLESLHERVKVLEAKAVA